MRAQTKQRNSDAFISTFSAIERWLHRSTGESRSTSFSQLVDRASRNNSAVRRYRDDLKEFADLRNAIVHERSDEHVIAEPNERALAEFEGIKAALLNPPRLIPKFQRPVLCRTAQESVGQAASDMRAGSFSQIPIRSEGKVVELLTTETIVRWLASEVTNDLVSLMDTKIEEVLTHTEDHDHYCFLGRKDTLHDAVTQFEDFVVRGKKLDAILITDGGDPSQQLLGILTVEDLPIVLEVLGLRRVSAT